MWISEIITTCGVSIEKFPLLMKFILSLLFGQLSPEVMTSVVKASPTYAKARERWAERLRLNTISTITSDDTRTCNLLIDASEKKEKDIMLKLLNVHPQSGVVFQTGLSPVFSMSKKCNQSSKQIVQSLLDELGAGIVKITSTTSDWVHDGNEPQQILEAIDDKAASMEAYKVISSRDVTQIYDYGGKFRQFRAHPCDAHAADRILHPLNDLLYQDSGLSHDTATGQGMFRLNYYISSKCLRAYRFILEKLYTHKDKVPKDLWNKFGRPSKTRWLVMEKQSAKLCKLLNYEATDEMCDILRKDYKVELDSDNHLPCLNPTLTRPSLYMAVLLAVCNSATSQACIEIKKVLAFLSSAEHRVSIVLMSALLPLHQRMLAFANGHSDVYPMDEVTSNRIIENGVEHRNLLEELHGIADDWHIALPAAYTLVTKILLRTTGEDNQYEKSMALWEQKLSKCLATTLAAADKYFVDIYLGKGFSFGLLTDPMMGGCVAQGIIRALLKHNLIPRNGQEGEQRIIYAMFITHCFVH